MRNSEIILDFVTRFQKNQNPETKEINLVLDFLRRNNSKAKVENINFSIRIFQGYSRHI